MANEIEHKYLVVGPYKQLATSKHHIVQGYLSADKARTVRVRVCDQTGYLTVKGPSSDDGLERYEFETEIPLQEALAMIKFCLPGVIDKHRYLIPLPEGLVCEVDEFHGDNEGLVMAEIEVKDKDDVCILPPFIGQELTGDKRFYNSQLSQRPFKSWKEDFFDSLTKTMQQ